MRNDGNILALYLGHQLQDISANIFSQSLACLWVLVTVCFEEQNFVFILYEVVFLSLSF